MDSKEDTGNIPVTLGDRGHAQGSQAGRVRGIFLRKLCKTELYLRLIVSGRTFLEISGIRYLKRYPGIPDKVGKRKRRISFEILESLFMGFSKYGNMFIQAVKKSLTDPYRSTRGILGRLGELNLGELI